MRASGRLLRPRWRLKERSHYEIRIECKFQAGWASLPPVVPRCPAVDDNEHHATMRYSSTMTQDMDLCSLARLLTWAVPCNSMWRPAQLTSRGKFLALGCRIVPTPVKDGAGHQCTELGNAPQLGVYFQDKFCIILCRRSLYGAPPLGLWAPSAPPLNLEPPAILSGQWWRTPHMRLVRRRYRSAHISPALRSRMHGALHISICWFLCGACCSMRLIRQGECAKTLRREDGQSRPTLHTTE